MTCTGHVQKSFNEHDFLMKQFRQHHPAIGHAPESGGKAVNWRQLHAEPAARGTTQQAAELRSNPITDYIEVKNVVVNRYANN